MTQQKCKYCPYEGEEEEVRGHLLGSHQINTFQGGLDEHVTEPAKQEMEDVPLNEFSGGSQTYDGEPLNEEEEYEPVKVGGTYTNESEDETENTGLVGRFKRFVRDIWN